MLEIVTLSLAVGISITPSPDQDRALNQLAISYSREAGLDENIKKYEKRITKGISPTQKVLIVNTLILANAIDKKYISYRWEF